MGKDKSPDDLVKEKSFEYYKVENELQRKFVKQLEYNGFRKKEYYSNDDAAKRLSLLLDIINNFFVDNVKSEYLNNRKDHFDFFKIWRKFNRDVAHIDERIDVLNTVEYVDDNGKIYEQKRYELYEFSFDTIEGLGKRMLNAYNKFSPIYKKIAQREAILRQGIEGEKNLYNRLKIIGNKIRIIQNARYVIEDDFSVEHDMIVISEYGIFSIEIKNWGLNSHINEKGYLINKNGKSVNVIEQSMRHVHNLERLIQKEMYHDAKVHPLIVWVNEKSKITNDFKYVTVCNYNDVEFELFDSKKYSQIYSEEDIDAIYKKLQELKKPEKEYELDIDVEGLIASTPKFVAGLKCLPDLVEIDRKMKVTESTWKKLFRALVDVLSLVDW